MNKFLLLSFFIALFYCNVFAQKANSSDQRMTVQGKVIDSVGEPLIGVTVIVKNQSSLGVVTDLDGKFEIHKVLPYDILSFSFIGYKTLDVPIERRKVLNIQMSEDTEVLQEVVVVGYGSQKKSSVVGAISTIAPAKLSVPASSISHAIGGRISGVVSTQRSGEPGSDNATFTIRGLSTFGSGGGPLVLVDGIEGRSINDIDVDDIESFSVLKDASATAVYGVRGANGVVMITTRKGKVGKVNISVRYNAGITAPTRLPEYVDSYTYATLKNSALVGRGQAKEFSDMALDKFKYGLDPDLYPNVDWLNELTNKTAMNQKAQINVNGGSEVVRYYLSLGYYNESGFLKNIKGNGYNTNIDYDKYNFRTNVDVNISSSTTLELGVSGILFDRQRPAVATGDILGYTMTMNPTKFPMVYSNGKFPRMNDIENPYLLLSQRGYTKEMYNRIESNLILNQDFSGLVKGLKAYFKYSYDIENSYRGNYTKQVNTWFASGRDSDGNLILSPKDQGHTGALGYSKSDDTGQRVVYLETALTYNNIFKEVHRISGLLLYNQRQLVYYHASNLVSSLSYRSQGISGRASYSYGDRYFAEFNFGYNGSENFVKGNRFGFFPSYAIGWMVSNESWFEKIKPVVSTLKLRGSYGFVGNDKTGADRFPFYTTTSGGNGGYDFGVDANSKFGGSAEGLVGSPNLTWEKSRKANLGFELSLFNRVTIMADFFDERRTDIFVKRNSLSSVIGINPSFLPSANLGEMNNRGAEFTLDYTDRIGKVDVAFFTSYTFNRNKVIATEQAPALYDYQERQGRKYYGTIDMASRTGMGYIALGLFKDQADIDNSPIQTMASKLYPGDIKYKDVNSDGVIDQYDMVFMQSNTPEIIYGFGGSAMYKGFDFSVFFQGLGNCNRFLPVDVNPFYYANERGNVLKHVSENVFIPADISGNPSTENYNAPYPRMSLSSEKNNTQNSTYWLRSTSFLRLKNLEIGYTLPKAISQKIRLANARVYASGSNLFVWDSFKLWDPEVSDYASYPINKLVSVGVKLDF